MKNLALTEPVRLYLYSLVTVIAAGLVLFGIVDNEQSGFILAAAAVVLAVPAVEVARAKVTPVAAPNL